VSPAEAVRELLVTVTGITTTVGTRIYPVVAPPQTPPPFVVVTQITEDVTASFDASDASTLRAGRVQVDFYAKQYDRAHLLAEAAEDALEAADEVDGLRAFKLDSRDLFEAETLLHRVSMDFNVWFGR
jgi:hypothetical protein